MMESTEGQTAYNTFLKANAQLPTVFLTKEQTRQQSALLMPGIVVSLGRLMPVEYDFATLADGRRVVLTNLCTGLDASQVQPLAITSNNDLQRLLFRESNPQLKHGDYLRFYCFEQATRGEYPYVDVKCLKFQLDNDPRTKPNSNRWNFLSVNGRLAIANADNQMQGWALVVTDADEKCASTQQVVTTCSLYLTYTSNEALKSAADTYGNVSFEGYLAPDPQ